MEAVTQAKTTPAESVQLLKKLSKEYEENKKKTIDNCEHDWKYDDHENQKHVHKYGGMSCYKCICGATKGNSY